MEDTPPSLHDAVNQQENQKESILLIVEDKKELFEKLYDEIIATQPTLDKCKRVWVSTLAEAIAVLCDPGHIIAAAVIDNGFSVLSEGDRKGKTDSAGIALVQFMHGNSSDLLGKSIDDSVMGEKIGATEARYIEYMALKRRSKSMSSERRKALKKVPIVWTSFSPDASKVIGIIMALGTSYGDARKTLEGKGESIDVLAINEYTVCCRKGYDQLVSAFQFIENRMISPKHPTDSLPGNTGGPSAAR